jgi:SAM-dependent methyltransferase
MLVLQDLYPNWRELALHESSPGLAISTKFAREVKRYTPTHYYPDVTPGTIHQGFRCENLENQTFPNESFDLVITLDVFEHIFDYRRAFGDVLRTIRPGGAHIFTTPKYRGLCKTQDRAVIKDSAIVYLAEPEYHGNPIDPDGSLVTVHYGDDICEIIWNETHFPTSIYVIHEDKSGTQAEFMEVFVTKKL